ncbi:cyclic lactone autoinducer peptide [Cohnella luojiensis]|uniref:Cyclic lactone autoinducer peptide n=1 Tax=Cohnella luojiensis TaxID=652876 RepID=A0A4Y8LQJ2_9BACL|nr:cyclic lactone autoinducer peptide [Cohnella luojiensis]TFE23526.1 cyclic lactone autoinducer peptide [Cohnella luojiensis]
MKRSMAIGISRVLMLIAAVFVSTSSYYFLHRPEVPDELKR